MRGRRPPRCKRGGAAPSGAPAPGSGSSAGAVPAARTPAAAARRRAGPRWRTRPSRARRARRSAGSARRPPQLHASRTAKSRSCPERTGVTATAAQIAAQYRATTATTSTWSQRGSSHSGQCETDPRADPKAAPRLSRPTFAAFPASAHGRPQARATVTLECAMPARRSACSVTKILSTTAPHIHVNVIMGRIKRFMASATDGIFHIRSGGKENASVK